MSFSLDYQKFIDKLTKELKQNISLNHRMALVGRDLKDTVPTPCHGVAATYQSACPKSHTSWLWMPPGLRRPHLLWAICFSASPLSESRITPHTSTAGSCSPGPPSPSLQRCSQWVFSHSANICGIAQPKCITLRLILFSSIQFTWVQFLSIARFLWMALLP